nr:uncharacterized protein LOC111425178 [Onthophagus taurus]XP_022914770.1 uncharacterized protein LOC111425178 [Onthophagus taurus]
MSQKQEPENQFDDLLDDEMDEIMKNLNVTNIKDVQDETLNTESLEEMNKVNLKSTNHPFVFFEIDEIKNITTTNLPKTQQIKTCGFYYHLGEKIYLHQHPNAEKTQIFDGIEVNTDMISEFPFEGRLYESFGGLTVMGEEDNDPKVMFAVWFYRLRTGTYNDLVKICKKIREMFCKDLI